MTGGGQMAGQRQYWVISPKVDNKEKNVQNWKNEILLHKAAILGWGPTNKGNGGMGPRFRDTVRRGDIILIARGKKRADIVGFGIVTGEFDRKRLPPRKNEAVSLRYLDHFKACGRAPASVPLIKILQHSMAFIQLHPKENPHAETVRKWMEEQLELKDQESVNQGTASDSANQKPITVKETDLGQSSAFGYTRKTKAQVKKARKVEAKLLSDYSEWLRRNGRRLSSIKFNALHCDAWEKERDNLIEAKGSVSREDIRMAVGELLDYAFQGKGICERLNKAILLPGYPGDERVNWLGPLGIKIIWRKGQSFVDNANGQFT
jgi:hypothetical protein